MDLLSDDIAKIPQSESLEEFGLEYKCYQVIGEGGFGKVLKAKQLSDQKRVAIKFIPDKKISSWYFDQKQQKSIPMEIALLCRCHEVSGVIKIIKYFQIKEHKGWYIVMERFEKYIDLFDFITKKGHISERTASHYMTQLLTIVLNCHRLGVCHRDIKDENIVIDLETNKIYLIDFGAGGLLHDGVYTEFDGTRVYSPPEWIQFKRYNVSSLEVWSIGILLFDMVCGNLPFDNDASIVSSIFHFQRSLSVSCQDLIEKCLQRDPTKRIDINHILSHPWLTPPSKINSLERHKPRHTRSNMPASSFGSSQSFSKTCVNRSDEALARTSAQTSPFTTPQSSGLEDTADTHSSPRDSSHAPFDYLYSQRHSDCHYTYSLNNFRKV